MYSIQKRHSGIALKCSEEKRRKKLTDKMFLTTAAEISTTHNITPLNLAIKG
jgi:hypothetical protein